MPIGMQSYYAIPAYNNVAASSFYSHMPLGSSSYMNGFGVLAPVVPIQ